MTRQDDGALCVITDDEDGTEKDDNSDEEEGKAPVLECGRG